VKREGGEWDASGHRFSHAHVGQALVEYALVIAFVAMLAVASLLIFRPEVSSVLSNLSTSV
jgi:Flp pilus assembly pilin Flp